MCLHLAFSLSLFIHTHIYSCIYSYIHIHIYILHINLNLWLSPVISFVLQVETEWLEDAVKNTQRNTNFIPFVIWLAIFKVRLHKRETEEARETTKDRLIPIGQTFPNVGLSSNGAASRHGKTATETHRLVPSISYNMPWNHSTSTAWEGAAFESIAHKIVAMTLQRQPLAFSVVLCN